MSGRESWRPELAQHGWCFGIGNTGVRLARMGKRSAARNEKKSIVDGGSVSGKVHIEERCLVGGIQALDNISVPLLEARTSPSLSFSLEATIMLSPRAIS